MQKLILPFIKINEPRNCTAYICCLKSFFTKITYANVDSRVIKFSNGSSYAIWQSREMFLNDESFMLQSERIYRYNDGKHFIIPFQMFGLQKVNNIHWIFRVFCNRIDIPGGLD